MLLRKEQGRLDLERSSISDDLSDSEAGEVLTSELGEVVGHEESVESVLPLTLEDEIVPFGNDVSDRATRVGLAEGNTTVHASSSLNLAFVLGESVRNLGPILDTLARVSVRFSETLVPIKVERSESASDCREF